MNADFDAGRHVSGLIIEGYEASISAAYFGRVYTC